MRPLFTTKVIEPRLGKYEGETITGGSDLQNLSDKEKKKKLEEKFEQRVIHDVKLGFFDRLFSKK